MSDPECSSGVGVTPDESGWIVTAHLRGFPTLAAAKDEATRIARAAGLITEGESK